MSTIKLYPQDTVALATADLKKGETVVVDGQSIVLLVDIPNAHKIALKDFETGEAIRKYDNIIGYASRPIKKGEWIHEHNEVTGGHHFHRVLCQRTAAQAIENGRRKIPCHGEF